MKNQLDEIIRRIIRRCIDEQTSYHGLINFDNKEDIKKNAEITYDIFQIAYGEKPIGAESPKRLCRTTDFLTMVYNNGMPIAAAAYRTSLGGKKMFLIGCYKTLEGKLGVQSIIKRDIENFQCNYWVEASGAIEHWFKKNNGYPIPNQYAEYLLNKYNSIELDKDGFHYNRAIGNEAMTCKKMIFGFKSKEFYDKVMSEVDNYFGIRKAALEESAQSMDDMLQRALFIIMRIEEGYSYGLYELTPFMYKQVLAAIEVLKNQPKNETINSALGHAKGILEDIPVVQLHKI